MQGTPPGTILPPAYIESVARMAYLWGWPLVNNLNRALGMKEVLPTGLKIMYSGGFKTFRANELPQYQESFDKARARPTCRERFILVKLPC